MANERSTSQPPKMYSRKVCCLSTLRLASSRPCFFPIIKFVVPALSTARVKLSMLARSLCLPELIDLKNSILIGLSILSPHKSVDPS